LSPISSLQDRLTSARDLPSVLIAAHEAFGTIALAIRGSKDPAAGRFAALVRSAALAADGRHAVAGAPSLPLAPPGRAVVSRPAGQPGPGLRELAAALAGLAGTLADRLAQEGQTAADAGDQDACERAAECAGEIRELLTGAPDS
jgi:hypothetical protein